MALLVSGLSKLRPAEQVNIPSLIFVDIFLQRGCLGEIHERAPEGIHVSGRHTIELSKAEIGFLKGL